MTFLRQIGNRAQSALFKADIFGERKRRDVDVLANKIVAAFRTTTTGDHPELQFATGFLQPATGKMSRSSLRHSKQNRIGFPGSRFEQIT